MLGALFVILALSTPSPSASPTPPAAHRRAAPERVRLRPALAANDLYSRHARARMASYLRLRLMELREERLDRAAEVIRRRLPIDVLLGP